MTDEIIFSKGNEKADEREHMGADVDKSMQSRMVSWRDASEMHDEGTKVKRRKKRASQVRSSCSW